MIKRVADLVRFNLPQMVADLGHHLPLLKRTADLHAHLQDFGTRTLFACYLLKLVPRILRHAEVEIANGGI